jgi:CRP-like cAMP-binding protein
VDFQFPRLDVSMLSAADADRWAQEQLETQQRVQAFERIDFLAPLTPEERELLASRARTQLYAAGETVVREGDASTEFYIVARGRLSVSTESARREIAQLSAGQFFGEMALLMGEPRSATVRAVDDCELYVIDKPTFQQAIAGHKDLFEQISKIVAERQAQMARRRGEADETSEQLALRESSLLTRMRRFFGGED